MQTRLGVVVNLLACSGVFLCVTGKVGSQRSNSNISFSGINLVVSEFFSYPLNSAFAIY